MKTCAWCALDFIPAVSYQVYCSKDCRETATKEKIAERYRESKRKTRAAKARRCAGDCGTLLSIYNDKNFCTSCMVNNKKVEKMLKELRGLFDYEKE
jgi:uncharacterized protein YmfQ (DUF2313 family)